MVNPEPNAEVLLNLSFVDIGHWQPNGDFIIYELDGEDAAANAVLLDAKNTLYAFAKGEQVLYIGKTARSIRRRYVGYCRPGKRQATNERCHHNIKAPSPRVKRFGSWCSTLQPTSSMGISRSMWRQVRKTA
jgi:hypothetical protein